MTTMTIDLTNVKQQKKQTTKKETKLYVLSYRKVFIVLSVVLSTIGAVGLFLFFSGKSPINKVKFVNDYESSYHYLDSMSNVLSMLDKWERRRDELAITNMIAKEETTNEVAAKSTPNILAALTTAYSNEFNRATPLVEAIDAILAYQKYLADTSRSKTFYTGTKGKKYYTPQDLEDYKVHDEYFNLFMMESTESDLYKIRSMIEEYKAKLFFQNKEPKYFYGGKEYKHRDIVNWGGKNNAAKVKQMEEDWLQTYTLLVNTINELRLKCLTKVSNKKDFDDVFNAQVNEHLNEKKVFLTKIIYLI